MAEPAKDQLDALKQALAERRYDEAIRDARRLVLESGQHPDMQLLLGEALLAAGRNDEARVEMLALVRERPEESSAHRLLGEAYLRDRQLDPARASLRRAVELDPDDEVARDLLLEADSETAAPASSTVERWMAAAEPATAEMTMPEYLAAAPALTPSPSLRALLERAQSQPPAIARVPRPAGVTAKMPRQPSASLDSLSMELDVDPDASTGQRARPKPPNETGELSVEDLEPAPSPRSRSVPPPTPSREPASASSETGELSVEDLEPARANGRSVPPRPPPSRSVPRPDETGELSVEDLEPAPRQAPRGASGSATNVARLRPRSRDGVEADANAGLRSTRSAPPGPRSVPPAPLAGSLAPPARSVPPPAAGSIAPAPRSVSPTARSVRPSPRSLGEDDGPTRPALRSERPMPSSSTLLTGGQPAMAGALLSPITADNVAITSERGMPRPVAAPPSTAGTPGPWPAKTAIPTASPPPKLGSMGSSPALASSAPSPYAPMPGPLAREAGARSGVPHLGGRSAAPPEPVTKPTVRAPGGRGEVTQRVRLTQFTVALVLGGIVAVALLVAIGRWLDARERDEALAMASDNGSEADVERALEATESAPASRARLFATATVELGDGGGEAVEAMLTTAAPGPEASVARSLVAVSRGQATEALVMLEELEASGVTLAEGARARALALLAMGRFPEAQAAAGQAWGFRPAVRHACLLAHSAALAGDVGAAETTLQSILDADARPCARLVRAEVALERSDLATVENETTVVLGVLVDRATRADEAWAHHLRGRGARMRGDMTLARAEQRAAAEMAPPADETLLLGALDGLLAAGDAAAAQELSSRLTPNAPNPARRADMLVAIALERHDFAAADASLALLTPGPRSALARGRVLEARGSVQAALDQYAAAVADPNLAVDAALRRARLLSRLGRDGEARGALEDGARTSPTDPTLAAALAHVLLATDDPRAARAALEPAFRVHADDARLAAISARILARGGEVARALTAARSAAERAADDPEVQLDLVEVAHIAGDRATEAQACDNALRLDPQRLGSTMCTVRLAIDSADFLRATQLLEQARTAGAADLPLSRLRAELAVAEGHGALDVETVRAFLRAHPNDVPLLVSLARLLLQAEDSAAGEAAQRVLSLSPEHPEATYVRAYVAYVDGNFATASGLLDRTREAARDASLRARVAALRGMLAYEDRRYGDPEAMANDALAADPRCATAHLLRAVLASRDQAAERAALEAAARGTDAPAEAIARLANSLGPSARGCELANRYVRMAPSGYDRRDVDRVRDRCR